jgi:hypothetical protein
MNGRAIIALIKQRDSFAVKTWGNTGIGSLFLREERQTGEN